MTILLVDDSRFQRLANGRALSKAGYIVIATSDGESALCIARERHPDLILLDIMLPKLDGISVLRALKREASTARIPVIVLSALAQRNQTKLLGEGARAYLEKNQSLLANGSEALLKIVASVLQESEQELTPPKV